MEKKFQGYKFFGLVVLVVTIGIVGLPALLVRGCTGGREPPKAQEQGPEVRLQIEPGKIVSLPLEEYLIGVVAAEMPASFHLEALKAQAVAARTYTLRRLDEKNRDKEHSETQLCADPSHCQAWISRAEMRKKWGFWRFGYYYERISAAVRATAGEVLIYQGELIDPVYHASCGGGGTEDAAEVWGYNVPYLQGVPCTWDPLHRTQPVFTSYAFAYVIAKLGVKEKAVPAAQGLNGLIQVVERTRSGRVKTVQIGGEFYRGVDLRKKLGLRSTDFTIETRGDRLIFETRGYGHAVGLCQYGAQGLALQGVNYRKILTYYYRGIQLKNWPLKK